MSNITKAIAALGVVAGLGVAALPLSSYAAESGPVKVTATIDNTISVTADTSLVNMGNIMKGGPVASGIANVTVETTSPKYTLAVKTLTSRTALAKVNAGVVDSTAPTIDAGVPAKGATAWGVRTGEGAYQAVKAAGTPIVTEGAITGTTTLPVEFGVSIGTGFTGEGTYENDVVFVATAVNE